VIRCGLYKNWIWYLQHDSVDIYSANLYKILLIAGCFKKIEMLPKSLNVPINHYLYNVYLLLKTILVLFGIMFTSNSLIITAWPPWWKITVRWMYSGLARAPQWVRQLRIKAQVSSDRVINYFQKGCWCFLILLQPLRVIQYNRSHQGCASALKSLNDGTFSFSGACERLILKNILLNMILTHNYLTMPDTKNKVIMSEQSIQRYKQVENEDSAMKMQ
jgi:hypothetical protein